MFAKALSLIIALAFVFAAGHKHGSDGATISKWEDYARALDSERSLMAKRDELVAALATEKQQRAQAQIDARKARQNVYAQDKNAAAWASERVPSAIAQQLRDTARAAVEASRGAEPDDLP